VNTSPVLRLDRDLDRTPLWETTKRLRPPLVLLDPLVRLHGIDENHAGEVARLLAYSCSLQRQLELSVLQVHHTRKNAAGETAAGQGLRGSSDIHAFGDSILCLRRTKEHLVLSSEHRAVAASASVYPELVATNAETTDLEVIAEPQGGKRRSLEERLLDLLAPGAVLTRAKPRESLAVQNERLGGALASLEQAGRICRTPTGWQRPN
jgi:AAA domain